MSAPVHNLNLGNYKTEIECPTVVDKNRRLVVDMCLYFVERPQKSIWVSNT